MQSDRKEYFKLYARKWRAKNFARLSIYNYNRNHDNNKTKDLIVYCGCGCGNIVAQKTKRVAHFIRGHKTKKTRELLSVALRGRVSPNKGNRYSMETRRKMSEARKGILFTQEWKNNISKGRRGIRFSTETIRKMSAQRRGLRRGPENPRWRGGITKITELIRKSCAYKEWRRRVYERDNWTCQNCGVRGGDIEAHHKERFSDLFQKAILCFPNIHQIEAADRYMPLWNIDNGITLCKKCHKETKRRR